MWLEATLLLVALGAALAAQPWRMLASRKPLVHERHGTPSALWTPLLAALVLLCPGCGRCPRCMPCPCNCSGPAPAWWC